MPLASAAVSALMGGGSWDHNWALAPAAAAFTGSQVASSGDGPTSLPAQHVELTTGGIQVAVLQVAGWGEVLAEKVRSECECFCRHCHSARPILPYS